MLPKPKTNANPSNYRNADGPFVLRFTEHLMTAESLAHWTNGSPYRDAEGQYVRNNFTSATGPGTDDLRHAKLFYTVASAKNSSYGFFCQIVAVTVELRV